MLVLSEDALSVINAVFLMYPGQILFRTQILQPKTRLFPVNFANYQRYHFPSGAPHVLIPMSLL